MVQRFLTVSALHQMGCAFAFFFPFQVPVE
jgi:hypothetical protein